MGMLQGSLNQEPKVSAPAAAVGIKQGALYSMWDTWSSVR